jgi:hypothetical protein
MALEKSFPQCDVPELQADELVNAVVVEARRRTTVYHLNDYLEERRKSVRW